MNIDDMRKDNEEYLNRINAPTDYKDTDKIKWLVFENGLAHKDDLIEITDCELATKTHRTVHALKNASIIKTIYPNVELYTMHNLVEWNGLIDWCIDNNIRGISMSFVTAYTEERDKALERFVKQGGICIASSGNWEDKDVSYPASSDWTIGVSATNSEDSNGEEVDITTDSWWRAKRFERDETIGFSGTSGVQPVIAGVSLWYINGNKVIPMIQYQNWLLRNSIDDISHFNYRYAFGRLEKGERFFVFPDDLTDEELNVEKTVIKMYPTYFRSEGSPIYYVNGESKTMDTKPKIENGRTLVPIRFVAEELGCDVSWDAEKGEVKIIKR